MSGREFDGLGPLDVHVWVVRLDAPDRQRRHELARSAQREVIGGYLGLAPATVALTRQASGKPVLADGALQFNLSHSGAVALVAVSRELPVGVDVQEPHPAPTRSWFAKRICSPREYERVGALADPEALMRLWVRKEAVIKARGEGSYVSVDGVDVLDDQVEGGWLCQDLPIALPGYQAAVVTRDVPRVTITVRDF